MTILEPDAIMCLGSIDILPSLFLGLILAIACALSGLSAQARPWTVRDSVELCKVNGSPAFSPDGRHFCVFTRKGVLRTNQIESTIWLFDTNRVKAFCRNDAGVKSAGGQAIVTMSADTYDEEGYPTTISGIVWAKNSQEFYFLARGKKWERRLFSCNWKTRHVKQLSADGEDVSHFELRNNSIIILESHPPDPAQLYNAGVGPNATDIVRGTGFSSTELMFPNIAQFRYGLAPRKIGKIETGKLSYVIAAGTKTPISFRSLSPMMSVSPDGHYALVKAQVERIPPHWSKFETAGPGYASFKPDDANLHSEIHRPEQIKLIDLRTGKFCTLINAPLGEDAGYHRDFLETAWAPSGTKVAIANTFFPLMSSDRAAEHVRPCIVVADIASGRLECVTETKNGEGERPPVWALNWDNTGSILQVEGNDFKQRYTKVGDHWQPLGAQSKLPESGTKDIDVFQYQDLNKPQVLMACLPHPGKDFSDLVASGEAKVVLNPNPQLADVEMGEASIFKWTDKDGRECIGGLVKPPGFKTDHRYPLLIQTHSFNRWEFFSCGTSTTANPGRALAARGVIVLQVDEPRRNSKFRGTRFEAEKDGRDCYVSAIEKLAALGLVDIEKVGIIGYSRTGWYVLDCLINAPKYFRAATLADANSSSYGEYLRNVDFSSDGSNYLDKDYGCKPYGDGLKVWLENAAGFNTDKIHAPVLVQINNPYGLLDWSTYPALRMQNKPVDLLYFRNGSHSESKPKLIFASMETNADWFDFWLNQHEDPDKAKAAQYVRWRNLREMQQQDGSSGGTSRATKE
jgi:dienelactone hydrolase